MANIERLKEVIEVLRKTETFHMDFFFYRGVHTGNFGEVKGSDKHPCGTPACIAGHAVALFEPDLKFDVRGEYFASSAKSPELSKYYSDHFKNTADWKGSADTDAGLLLGLTHEESSWLFYNNFCDPSFPWEEVTPKMAIKAIEYVIAGHPVKDEYGEYIEIFDENGEEI